MDRVEVEVHKNVKRERGQYPAILTSRLVNKGFIIWLYHQVKTTKKLKTKHETILLGQKFFSGKRVIPNGQDSSILPARVANHNAGFDSSCPLAEPAI